MLASKQILELERRVTDLDARLAAVNPEISYSYRIKPHVSSQQSRNQEETSRQLRLTVNYVRRINQEKQEWMRKEISLQNEIRELRQQNMDFLQSQATQEVALRQPSYDHAEHGEDALMTDVNALQAHISGVPPIPPPFQSPLILAPVSARPSDSSNPVMRQGLSIASSQSLDVNDRPTGPDRTAKNMLNHERRPAFRRARKKQDYKSAEETENATEFRKFFGQILGISRDDQPKRMPLVAATPPPANVWDEGFSIFLEVPVQKYVAQHSWNVAVRELVVQTFLTDNPIIMQSAPRAKSKAIKYVQSPGLKLEDLREQRRIEYRIQLFNTRKSSARNSEGGFRKSLVYNLSLLTASCMSSDEEDPEDLNKTCIVVDKDWRSPDLVAILKWLDLKGAPSAATPGGARHSRIRKPPGQAPLSRNSVVSGLPINFYNSSWYGRLSGTEVCALGAIDSVSLPVEVLNT
ncbi:hypothetical protein C8R43DRAFT_950544 [Mycena crocata]|nr:hypothetical protein C8R43DRAFT_950544 [Mycena crocata]